MKDRIRDLAQRPASVDRFETIHTRACCETLGVAFWWLAERFYGCEISGQSSENITLLNQHLKNGSSILHINHISKIDGPLVVAFSMEKLGRGREGNMTRFSGLVGQKHVDFRRSPMAPLIKVAPAFGVKVTPIVQHYERDRYSKGKQRKLLRAYREAAAVTLSKKGGIWMHAGEGTRSETGALQRVQDGMYEIRDYGDNVCFTPVGIVPKERKLGRGFDVGRVEIRVGKPMKVDGVVEEGAVELVQPFLEQDARPVDVVMLELAAILPKNMRGYYMSAYENVGNFEKRTISH